jgi:hypothetical protein
MPSHHTAGMKKNKLEIYELADIPAVFIEQVAENVLDLVRTEIEADNLDECAVMPLGVPIELQATRLVLYSLASQCGVDVRVAVEKARKLVVCSLQSRATGRPIQ